MKTLTFYMLKYNEHCGLAELELRFKHSWSDATIPLNQYTRHQHKPLEDFSRTLFANMSFPLPTVP